MSIHIYLYLHMDVREIKAFFRLLELRKLVCVCASRPEGALQIAAFLFVNIPINIWRELTRVANI